jgi:autotransporter-associated beta strand protein
MNIFPAITYGGTADLTFSGTVASGNQPKIFTISNNVTTFSGPVTDGGAPVGPITKDGPGTMVMSYANTFTKNLQINKGTLKIDGSGSLGGGSYAGTIVDNGTFNYNSSSAQTLSGAISGSGVLVKGGSSTLTLSGANTYTSNTVVNAGTLEIVNAVLNTNSTVYITNGASLQLDFAVTNKVGALVLNGTNKPAGVYNSTTATGYITGTGSLLVAAAGPSGPAKLTNSISGNTLTLTWPAGQGWVLLSQTNSLATGLNTNAAAWQPAAGGIDGSNSITVDPTKPTVFYKLQYPYP